MTFVTEVQKRREFVKGLEGLSKSYRYIHWNLQKHRHIFPNGSPHNSCIIRPWATSRKALKALETSIPCLHRTTHKQPKYATSSRVGLTAKVVTFLMFTVTAVLCVWKRGYSQHWVWYWWLTVKLRASILSEVSKLTLFFLFSHKNCSCKEKKNTWIRKHTDKTPQTYDLPDNFPS